MELSARGRWIAQIIELGLREQVLENRDLVKHVDPDVMANHLPEEIVGEVLASALEAGELTATGVIYTVTPQILAEHIPHKLLWDCITEAVQRADIDKAGSES